jgi:glucokinase
MFLGVEIGGTKLQVGVGRGDGTIVQLWRGAVDRAAGADGICRQVAAAVPRVLAEANLGTTDIRGVGIGFGGPIDDATRGVLRSHQVEGWDGFPLADWAEKTLGCPCAIGNDADVAGLGEALFGAGKGLSPIFYMTIGSGIGGGLIIDRKIYRGAGKGAAEVGHLRMVQAEGPIKLEALCSGWGLEVAAAEKFGSNTSCADLADRARNGDFEVSRLLEERWTILAEAICHVIALLCPRRIIIGGGVSFMGDDVFFEPLRKKISKRVFKPFADCYEIVPTALGEEVVVHGALALAQSVL